MKKLTQSQMLLKTARSLVLILTTLMLCQLSQVQAALTVQVTGDAAGGGTTWVFNGTSFVGFGNTQTLGALNQDLAPNINFWGHSSGELDMEIAEDVIYDQRLFGGFAVAGESVSGSISGAFAFDGLFLNSDGFRGSDDFGWLIGNQAAHTFTPFETITYDNYTLVTNLDITTFGEGANNFGETIENNGDRFTASSTTEFIGDLSLTFSAVAVPEPSSALLLGVSALGFLARRKRGYTR